jgi:hypothetical protein
MREFSLNILYVTENHKILAYTKETSTSGKHKFKTPGNNTAPKIKTRHKLIPPPPSLVEQKYQ